MTALDHDLDHLVARLHAHPWSAPSPAATSFTRLAVDVQVAHVCGWALLFRIRLAGPHGRIEHVSKRGGRDG